MKKSNLVIALYMLAVFASGTLVGAFGQWLYTAKSVSAKITPDEWRKRYLGELHQRLSLDEGQLANINKVFDTTRSSYRVTKERQKRELREIHDAQVQQVRDLLRPDQVAEYDKIREEKERLKREAEARDKKP